jgi:hypothetical protein
MSCLETGETLCLSGDCFFFVGTSENMFSLVDLEPSPVEDVPADAVDWF